MANCIITFFALAYLVLPMEIESGQYHFLNQRKLSLGIPKLGTMASHVLFVFLDLLMK